MKNVTVQQKEDIIMKSLLLRQSNYTALQDKLHDLYPSNSVITSYPVSSYKLKDIFGDANMSYQSWVKSAVDTAQLEEQSDYTIKMDVINGNVLEMVYYLTVSAAIKVAMVHNNVQLGVLVARYLEQTAADGNSNVSAAAEQQQISPEQQSLTQEISSSSQQQSPFDSIRHLDEEGNEYWYARELQQFLNYGSWQMFVKAIERAKNTAVNVGENADYHFNTSIKMVSIGSGAQREVQDYRLTRYACYVIAMNGDPHKPEIAAAQTYFMSDYSRLKEQEEKALAVKTEQASDDTVEANNTSPFDQIKHLENGQEVWYARELQKFLNYSRWDDFKKAIERAQASTKNAGIDDSARFEELLKTVKAGIVTRQQDDYRLNRYSCYVIAMNGDPHKPEIAAAQTYFAVKTRQAEVQQQPVISDAILQKLVENQTLLQTCVISHRDRLDVLEKEVDKLKEQKDKGYSSVVKEDEDYDPATADGDISVQDMAEILKQRGFDIGRQRLFDWMAENKMVRKLRKKGYQPLKRYLDLGVLSCRETENVTPSGLLVAYSQVMVTPKGKRFILERFIIGDAAKR